MDKSATSVTITNTPSKDLLYWTLLGYAEANSDSWNEMSFLEQMSKASRIAAEMAFGPNCDVHTDQSTFFSVRVRKEDEKDELYFGNMAGIPSHFTDGDTSEALMNWLPDVANNIHRVMSEMAVADARETPPAGGHLTVQQLFLASDPAVIMAIASTLFSDEASSYLVEYQTDGLWSAYQGICQAKPVPLAGFVTIPEESMGYVPIRELQRYMGIVPVSELQNPLFSNPVWWSWEEAYDIADIASMPISNLSLERMDEDIVAGRILESVFFDYYYGGVETDLHQCPTSVCLRAETMIDDGLMETFALPQPSTEASCQESLAKEKEEFLEPASC